MPQAMYLEPPASGTHWSISKFFVDKPIGLSAAAYSIYTFADGTYMGHLYTGDNTRSAYIGIAIGTITLKLRRNDSADSTQLFRAFIDLPTSESRNFREVGAFTAYDAVNIEFSSPGILKRIRVYLPAFSASEQTLYVDRAIFGTEQLIRCRTFTDSGYSTLACGLVGTRVYDETISFTEVVERSGQHRFYDAFSFTEQIRFNPRQYPPAVISFSESISIISQRHATITDWQFSPDYRVLFDENDTGGYATTVWHNRINNYGIISKSIKHWTGDFEVGNWQPTFVDEANELWGSLYGAGKEARNKQLRISAMINDRPLTYTPQFTGRINQTSWRDGQLVVDFKDNMKGLPDRNFVYDYANLGSSNKEHTWGVVVKVLGTQVMFDDFGDVKYIERYSKGRTFFESFTSGLAAGFLPAISGNWAGAAIGFGLGFGANLPSGDKKIGGYYEIQDFDAIPEDMVKSGIKLKFYPGSISGIATNLNHPLVKVLDRAITGGTFRQGLYGTFSLDTTEGISINDYIYIRQPVILRGSPNEITKALLTGSNIDYPYTFGGETIVWPAVPGGVPSIVSTPSDFSSDWNNEWESLELVNVGKTIGDSSEPTPFDELKTLLSELQVSFYLNEQNKFTVKTIRPRALINPTVIATYTEGVNILGGFEFQRSITDARAGFRIFYDFVGEGVGAFEGGYNKKYELQYSGISNVTQWDEIKSQWIHLDEDAKAIAWRSRIHTESGIDKINLPTTLYGVIHQLTDIIKVTHQMGSLTNRLFEIDSYQKNFQNHGVTLTAIDVERSYGYGNCKWSGTAGAVDSNSLSGYSVYGPIGSLTNVGSLVGTVGAFDSNLQVYNIAVWYQYQGKLLSFGSMAAGNAEVIYLKELLGVGAGQGLLIVQRGVFNTIARTYFTGEKLYHVGDPTIDKYGIIHPTKVANNTYRQATCIGINSNIGSSFKFF